jgi:hypothetical protein
VKIKCITLWQPWASLIAIEAKPLEFRGWSYTQRPTGVKPGDRIAIAAGARKVRETDIIDLLERIDDAEGSTGLVRDKALPWPMLDVRPTEPIPCKGAQGFFWVSVPEVEVDAR